MQRAIDTVIRATELDLEGMYGEAVTQYDAALHDFDTVVAQGTSRDTYDVTCHTTHSTGASLAQTAARASGGHMGTQSSDVN